MKFKSWVSTNSESRTENCSANLGFRTEEVVRAIPRVAPRMPWNSESCSENCLFTQRLFSKLGGSQVSESLWFEHYKRDSHIPRVEKALLESQNGLFV